MADISVTAASIVQVDGNAIKLIAAEAITAGEPCYKNASTLKAHLLDADLSAAGSTAIGIAVCDAAAGQPVVLATTGNITFNAVLTKGEIYVASGTAGGIAPKADLASGDYVTILGVASSTTNLKVHIYNSGVTV